RVAGRGEWITVTIVPGSKPEAVLAALFDAGAQGVQEIADAYVTHVASQAEADALVRAASAASPDARAELKPLPDVDWSEEWKWSIHAQALRSLTLAPP